MCGTVWLLAIRHWSKTVDLYEPQGPLYLHSVVLLLMGIKKKMWLLSCFTIEAICNHPGIGPGTQLAGKSQLNILANAYCLKNINIDLA